MNTNSGDDEATVIRSFVARNLTAVVSTALGLLLATATVGTWEMSRQFLALQQQVQNISDRQDRGSDRVERQFETVHDQIGENRDRIRALEQRWYDPYPDARDQDPREE